MNTNYYFLPGNVVADLNIKLLAASLSNKVDFLLIELADIDIVSTAKKLDANNVFIYSAIIHISASQYCILNTAVTQIELFIAFKIFLASDVVSQKYKFLFFESGNYVKECLCLIDTHIVGELFFHFS